ncbi:hypothetical protein ABLN87_19885 [Ruegeria sp. SCPT10]|uniref:hypothetical protein n=1 Tax=Ruegeria sp. SCP10 TaxID=3141377 RepID=UPI003338764E
MTEFDGGDQVPELRFNMLFGNQAAKETIPYFIGEKQSVLMALNVRILLRSLPRMFIALVDRDPPDIDAIILSAFRAAISTAVGCKYPNFLSDRDAVSEELLQINLHQLDSVVHIANSCAQFFGANSERRGAELVAGSIDASLLAFPENEVVNQVLADQEHQGQGTTGEQVFYSPLFSVYDPPDNYKSAMWYFDQVPNNGPWIFWRSWYQGYFDGQPLDWELQKQIALIHNSIWNAGPNAVADEIRRVRARLKVESSLAELEVSLEVKRLARHSIGGNNPPESIHDERLSGAITLIWEATEELSTALEEENPAREWIEAILSKLKSGLTSLLKWCAGKVNLAVGTVIVVGATKGTTVVVDAYISKHPEKIEALIEALERWLPFLS